MGSADTSFREQVVDLVTLCSPAIDETSRGGKRLSRSVRSNRQRRAREVIEGMADKGHSIIEEVDNGLRITQSNMS